MKCPHCGTEFETDAEQYQIERRRKDAERQKRRYYAKKEKVSREPSVRTHVSKQGNGTKPPKKNGCFAPPTYKEVRAYCDERGNQVDPVKFVDHYTANGWVQGRGKPIKNWQAAVRYWEKSTYG